MGSIPIGAAMKQQPSVQAEGFFYACGPVPGAAPGLWVSTAMGSRGLSFAALCAELLAARWHGEPLPVPALLARALDTARVRH